MNVNSLLQTQAIKDWLLYASGQLSNIGIKTANLDAEIILADTIKKDRTYLHAHNDENLRQSDIDIANKRLSQRMKRLPIAYIICYKEFYGRNFFVTPETLIPRPESEDIINLLHQIIIEQFKNSNTQLIDIGTGSGCLGITAKLEFPQLDVTLTDIDSDTLLVAKKNAEKLLAKVKILQSDLLNDYKKNADIIIANLPYVDKSWVRSPETEYEPTSALFASDKGLYLIKKLIDQASDIQAAGNIIILESDPCQHLEIIDYAKKYHYEFVDELGYAIEFIKSV